MEPKTVRPPRTHLLASTVQKKDTPLDGAYEGLKKGRSYSNSLEWVRRMMHAEGHIPNITLDPKGGDIRRLTVRCGDADCIVTQVDSDSMRPIQNFLEHFKIIYSGQSLPTATGVVFPK